MLKTVNNLNQQAAWFFLGRFAAGWMPSVLLGASSKGASTIMILLVILTQRRETESEPPRRQDRPEDLEAADVHVLHVVASES